MNTFPNMPRIEPKYAILIAGLATGLVKPENAVRQIARDLQDSGMDVRGMVAQLRRIFARSDAALAAIDRIFEPEKDQAPPTITVRVVQKDQRR